MTAPTLISPAPGVPSRPARDPRSARWVAATVAALAGWAVLYSLLQPFADWVVAVLPIAPAPCWPASARAPAMWRRRCWAS